MLLPHLLSAKVTGMCHHAWLYFACWHNAGFAAIALTGVVGWVVGILFPPSHLKAKPLVKSGREELVFSEDGKLCCRETSSRALQFYGAEQEPLPCWSNSLITTLWKQSWESTWLWRSCISNQNLFDAKSYYQDFKERNVPLMETLGPLMVLMRVDITPLSKTHLYLPTTFLCSRIYSEFLKKSFEKNMYYLLRSWYPIYFFSEAIGLPEVCVKEKRKGIHQSDISFLVARPHSL